MNLQSDAETDSSSLLEMERSPSHKSYGGAEMDQVDGAAPAELPARNQTSNCIGESVASWVLQQGTPHLLACGVYMPSAYAQRPSPST